MRMQAQENSRVKKIMRQTGGYACVAVGAAGCVLPILPGIPLMLLGLGLLAVDSPRAARLRDRLKAHANRQIARLRGKADPAKTQTRVRREIR